MIITHDVLSQHTECSYLCCAVRPCLSTVCNTLHLLTLTSQPIPSSPTLLLGSQTSVLCVCESVL